MPPLPNHRGFTLVELMVTVLVAIIIASALTASWRVLTEKISAYRVQSDLTQTFSEARSHAITRARITTICPLDEALNCSSDWDGVISIFLDPANEQALTEKGELIANRKPAGTGTLRASNAGPAERRYFQYNPDGSARGTIGHIVWCPRSADPEQAMQVRLNFGGRITWARDRDQDGIADDANGAPLTCG